MRLLVAGICLVLAVPLVSWSDEPTEKADYREFAKLIHGIAVKRLPKEVEDVTGWGATIPVPPKLPLPGLRKFLKVGDHLELPHGAWRRLKGKIDDPERDLKITVRDFRQTDPTTYRLTLDADARLLCAGEWQQWQKGLMLLDVTGQADADVTIGLVCDVGVSFDFGVFPPKVALDPKVTELGIDLRDLKFRRIDNNIIAGDLAQTAQAKRVAEMLRVLLHDVIKAHEGEIKEYANQAIARGLRDGKGTISAATILKALPKAPQKK